MAALAPVNALADAAPGFVWRLQTEEGDATAVRIGADPLVIVNLSVWASLEALWAFVYGSAHVGVMQRRRTLVRAAGRGAPRALVGARRGRRRAWTRRQRGSR